MPSYITSPFKPTPQLLVPGTPSYLWGSFNDKTGPTLGSVISNSAVTTTATLKFQILSGNIPVNGSLITVVGCANSANFNVTNVAIGNVTSVPVGGVDTGIYTCTYTITSTSQSTLPDGGQISIPQPEVGETISGTGASAPVAVGAAGPNSNGKSLSVSLTLPNSGTLSGVTVTLEGAQFDIDSAYQTVATIGTTLAANSVTEWQSGQGVPTAPSNTLSAGNVTLPNFRFYRLHATVVTGSGPVIGKILL